MAWIWGGGACWGLGDVLGFCGWVGRGCKVGRLDVITGIFGTGMCVELWVWRERERERCSVKMGT